MKVCVFSFTCLS